MRWSCRSTLWPLVVAGTLAAQGCSSLSAPTLSMAKAAAALVGGQDATDLTKLRLNPARRYLRAEISGRPPVLMVLGFLDPSPLGPVEVWYAAGGAQVIRMAGGRLVGVVGLEHDWRTVRFLQPPPAWQMAPAVYAVYERTRDVMPGYRFSVRETLQLSSSATMPREARAVHLPPSVSWFTEQVLSPTPAELPPSIYAVIESPDQVSVVYTRQCLTRDLCIHLQPWPVSSGGS